MCVVTCAPLREAHREHDAFVLAWEGSCFCLVVTNKGGEKSHNQVLLLNKEMACKRKGNQEQPPTHPPPQEQLLWWVGVVQPSHSHSRGCPRLETIKEGG